MSRVKKKKYVYLVVHKLDENRKAVLYVFATEARAREYCEWEARNMHKEPMGYKLVLIFYDFLYSESLIH